MASAERERREPLPLAIGGEVWNGRRVAEVIKRVFLLIIWDGSPIHRAEVIKKFLASGAARRLHLEQPRGYAPDLNPKAHVWNLLKRRELKNLCCQDLAQLGQELVRAKERLRHRQKILQNCFAHALEEV